MDLTGVQEYLGEPAAPSRSGGPAGSAEHETEVIENPMRSSAELADRGGSTDADSTETGRL